jgi:hypothetical protein
VILSLLIVTQIAVLSYNGFLKPYFPNTNHHSIFAKAVLDNYPSLYNPTPEIFIDRTTHTDVNYLHSAVYKKDGVCKKAFVLSTDRDFLLRECKTIPEKYAKSLDNEFLRKANVPRKVRAREVTFWSDDYACSPGKTWKDSWPFICMRTIDEVVQQTGIKDKNRITKIPEFSGEGIWKIKYGKPVEVTIPPGYFIHYNSLEGVYVDY